VSTHVRPPFKGRGDKDGRYPKKKKLTDRLDLKEPKASDGWDTEHALSGMKNW
jgi:hypothetical protein